jgi:hypothetical protein
MASPAEVSFELEGGTAGGVSGAGAGGDADIGGSRSTTSPLSRGGTGGSAFTDVTLGSDDAPEHDYFAGDPDPGDDGARYTVDEAIDGAGFGRFQIMMLCFTGLAWMGDAMAGPGSYCPPRHPTHGLDTASSEGLLIVYPYTIPASCPLA